MLKTNQPVGNSESTVKMVLYFNQKQVSVLRFSWGSVLYSLDRTADAEI